MWPVIDFNALEMHSPRILMEVAAQSQCCQDPHPADRIPGPRPSHPCNRPDGNGGTIPTLLVESAQSMANRLEAVCWDKSNERFVYPTPESMVESQEGEQTQQRKIRPVKRLRQGVKLGWFE